MHERLRTLALGAAGALAVIAAHTLQTPQKEIAWFVALFVILSHGHLLGRRLISSPSTFARMGVGAVLFLAVQSIAQTVWYYSGRPLGGLSDTTSLLVGIGITHLIAVSIKPPPENVPPSVAHGSRTRIIIGLLCLALAGSVFGFVLRVASAAATTESIRTPWPLLPDGTRLAVAFAWFALLLSAAAAGSKRLTALQATLAVVATTVIAPLVYRSGYGFDGFLHIASEKIILATGTLQPSPPYYIGQYVFTTWLARLTELPIAQVDRWLVPLAAPLLLTLCAYVAHRTSVIFLTFAFLPLAGFVATTPQGFSYVLGLGAIFLCLGIRTRAVHPIAPLLLVAWAIAVHPLAGVPLFFVVSAHALHGRLPNRITAALSGLCVVTAAAAVPVLFYLLSLKGGTPIAWNFPSVLRPEPWAARLADFAPWIGNRFALWPAWASLTSRLLPLLLLFFAGIGWRRARSFAAISGASAILLWIAATALDATGEFTFLIDYERGNYANRLNLLALFCLLPASAHGLSVLTERLRRSPRFIAIAVLAFGVAIPSALAYDALPRHDAVVTGRGWSSSEHDREAVKLINYDAGEEPYTVLANQSVSAAAVDLLGFKRYHGDVFFYPIPTGGPLYELFLRMTYGEPSRDTAKDAASLGGADLVYVVLNNYWWRSRQIGESLRLVADNDWTIPPQSEDGWKLRVFKFDFRNDSSAPAATSTR
ncbi:hypothetical protein HY479_00365 [Candidatus Uhrbacteria bacterium]|nr:hypothetical protein [Candidatus Uhrbacteria bacterium]